VRSEQVRGEEMLSVRRRLGKDSHPSDQLDQDEKSAQEDQPDLTRSDTADLSEEGYAMSKAEYLWFIEKKKFEDVARMFRTKIGHARHDTTQGLDFDDPYADTTECIPKPYNPVALMKLTTAIKKRFNKDYLKRVVFNTRDRSTKALYSSLRNIDVIGELYRDIPDDAWLCSESRKLAVSGPAEERDMDIKYHVRQTLTLARNIRNYLQRVRNITWNKLYESERYKKQRDGAFMEYGRITRMLESMQAELKKGKHTEPGAMLLELCPSYVPTKTVTRSALENSRIGKWLKEKHSKHTHFREVDPRDACVRPFGN